MPNYDKLHIIQQLYLHVFATITTTTVIDMTKKIIITEKNKFIKFKKNSGCIFFFDSME